MRPDDRTYTSFRVLHTGHALPEQKEGKGVTPPIWKESPTASYGCPAGGERMKRQDDVAKDEEERCNTRSAFKTSKYNSSNIRLNVDETFETCL